MQEVGRHPGSDNKSEVLSVWKHEELYVCFDISIVIIMNYPLFCRYCLMKYMNVSPE